MNGLRPLGACDAILRSFQNFGMLRAGPKLTDEDNMDISRAAICNARLAAARGGNWALLAHGCCVQQHARSGSHEYPYLG
jgi:hypothetical protein